MTTAPYIRPADRRVGDSSPQTDPDLFDDAAILAEIRYLLGLQRRHGHHDLRALAVLRLRTVLADRADGICTCEHAFAGTCWTCRHDDEYYTGARSTDPADRIEADAAERDAAAGRAERAAEARRGA